MVVGRGLTKASLSSVVSDSACKDLRNFGVTGGKKQTNSHNCSGEHTGQAGDRCAQRP